MQTHTCAKLGQTSSGFSRLKQHRNSLWTVLQIRRKLSTTPFFYFLFFGRAALTLCFLYNVHPLCSDSHCSITRTIGERRWNIAQLPFELAPAHDLMLNHFVTAERSNSKSDICQRRREWELKGRTRNCITMQEFLIFCTAATGLYRITFAFFFFVHAFLARGSVLMSGPRGAAEQVSPANLPVFHWQSDVSVGPTTASDGRPRGVKEQTRHTSGSHYWLAAHVKAPRCLWIVLELYLNFLMHTFHKNCEHIISFHNLPVCSRPGNLHHI